jgi:hypothetical protein
LRQIDRALLRVIEQRPGVATRMSVPRRRPSICGLMPTPPKMTSVRSRRYLP